MNTSSVNSSSVADLNALGTIIPLVACSVNLILSVPTNGYILWLIVTGAGGTMTTDFFTLNLCVSEILFCLSSVFLIISYHIQILEVTFLWEIGRGFLYIGRPLFQSCICVERYLAVIHPVTFLKYKPLRYRVGCCSAAWLFTLGSCVGHALLIGTATINYTYLVLYLILISVMLFCCLSVLWALKQPGPGKGDREMSNNMKMRAFNIILILLVSMLINYLPVLVNISLSHVVNQINSSFYILLLVDIISGIVHPLFFLHRAGKLGFIRGF